MADIKPFPMGNRKEEEKVPTMVPKPFPMRAPKQEKNRASPKPFVADPLRDSKVVKTDKGRMYDVNTILTEYNRPLIKEDFLEDKRLQNLVIENLEARMRPESFAGGARRLATKASGGATIDPRDYRSMDFEDVFETWQNYQRSFAIGQSVTTANEAAYVFQTDDETKAKLAAGYTLFDNMDNAITGEGSWAEMADAVWDYTRGAVFDPATIVSLGVGKALTSGSTKAAALGVKEVTKAALKKGVSQKAVQAAIKAAPYVAPDLAFNVGQDITYQLTRKEAGAQEDYSPFQTGIVAAGTLALPALLAGTKGLSSLRKSKVLKDTLVGYEELGAKLDPLPKEEAWVKLKEEVDVKSIIDGLDDQFGRVEGDFDKLIDWTTTKADAKDVLSRRPEEYTDQDLINKFSKYFFFGSDIGEQKGFVHMLREAGFYPLRNLVDEDEPISNAYAHAIKMLDDETVEGVIKKFERTVGRDLKIGYTADELSARFVDDGSTAGKTLQIRSMLERTAKQGGITGQEAIEDYIGKPAKVDPDSPKRFQYGLSVYKRLLTSHLATTGANLKGFGQLVGINTAADFASAAAYAAQSAAYKVKGDDTLSAFYGRRAAGSLKAPFRRVVNMLTPDLPMEYADKILELNPQMESRLFRDISGDGGVRDSLAHFNLDQEGLIWKTMDNVTKGAQTVTMVRMQDDLTKRWAFGSNLDSWILREYNMSPQKFYAQEDVMNQMASGRWKNVLDKAVQDTLRETASVNWSILPANKAIGSARWWAKNVEFVTNNTAVGYVIPFGSFLNTTVATLGDLTGVNAFRQMAKYKWGTPLDYADDEFARLFGKAVTGWSLAIYGINAAQDRIEKGLSWDTVEEDTGDLTSREFDWPMSTVRIISTILGHALDGRRLSSDGESIKEDFASMDISKVPDSLWTELFMQTGGQALRDMDDIKRTMTDILYEAKETGEWGQGLIDFLGSAGAKVIQGATRPLDPVNVMMRLTTDGAGNPDLNQGAKTYNQALRYVNYILPEKITGIKDLPQRADPTRGVDAKVTVGKQVLGNRVKKDPTIVEQFFNSAGVPTWKAVRWQGPEKVRNYMDLVISDFFNQEVTAALKANPNYFKAPQQVKERILQGVQTRARERTINFMKTSPVPKTLEAVRVLATADKEKLREVISFLGYEGGVEEIMEEDNALEKLQKIKLFVDNYDTMFPINR